MTSKKAAVIMGSDSDLQVMRDCFAYLKKFGIEFEARVISAHRTPKAAESFAHSASKNGFGVIIAAAGKAAHLAGVLAAYTTLPVIAVPIKSSALDGLDALLSMVQMPKGVPVATVAIDGAANAGILAAQILGVYDERISSELSKFKEDMAGEVIKRDKLLQSEVEKI